MKHLSENQLNEYLDNILDNDSRQEAETHLASCVQCRAELTELETLFSTLGELPEIPITHDLTQNILARLSKKTQVPALWRQPAFVMQSLLTIALVAFSIPAFTSFFEEHILLWESSFTLPVITLPTLAETTAEFTELLAWQFEFNYTLPELVIETPTMPTISSLPISPEPGIMLVLVAVATILWGFGNFSLLRNKPEARE